MNLSITERKIEMGRRLTVLEMLYGYPEGKGPRILLFQQTTLSEKPRSSVNQLDQSFQNGGGNELSSTSIPSTKANSFVYKNGKRK